MAHYSAALVSFLTSCIRILPFHTIDEFIADNTYKLIVVRGGSDYDVLSVSSFTLFQIFRFSLVCSNKLCQIVIYSIIDAFDNIINYDIDYNLIS